MRVARRRATLDLARLGGHRIERELRSGVDEPVGVVVRGPGRGVALLARGAAAILPDGDPAYVFAVGWVLATAGEGAYPPKISWIRGVIVRPDAVEIVAQAAREAFTSRTSRVEQEEKVFAAHPSKKSSSPLRNWAAFLASANCGGHARLRRINPHRADRDRTVQLTVVDRGIGIPAALRRSVAHDFQDKSDAEIIEAAVTTEKLTSRPGQFGGLGLKTVREVVLARGGRLTVMSLGAKLTWSPDKLTRDKLPGLRGTAVEIEILPGGRVEKSHEEAPIF